MKLCQKLNPFKNKEIMITIVFEILKSCFLGKGPANLELIVKTPIYFFSKNCEK